MILTCPSCDTGFHIDEGHIPDSGRKVRCSQCRHVWLATRPEEDPIDLKEAIAPVVETKEELVAVAPKALPKKYRAMVEDEKRQKAMMTQAYIWAGLGVIFAVMLILSYVLRVDIVRAVPAMAGAYQSVGLNVNGTNLEFLSYEAETAFKGGRFVVTVKAKIKNLSGKPMPVPPVRVRLYDEGLNNFSTQTIASGDLKIGPKAVQTMIFDVKDPQNLTSTMDLDFDLEALKKQKHGHGVALKSKPLGHDAKASDAHAEHGQKAEDAHAPASHDAPATGNAHGAAPSHDAPKDDHSKPDHAPDHAPENKPEPAASGHGDSHATAAPVAANSHGVAIHKKAL